jgi:hypothetical protein
MSSLRQRLAHDKFRYVAILAAIVLMIPALFHGLEVDDRLQRSGALGGGKLYFLGRKPTDLYTFIDGNPENTRWLMDLGIATWWTDPQAKISFFRPISSLLLWGDHHLLQVPFLLHLHSLLWYLGTIVVAFALYRRFLPEKWIAGLAGFMFAVDHTHGLPTGWIAQRNTLTTGFFGLLTLYFHDRARRDPDRARDTIFASICLGLALFSAEAALGILPYLLVHALIFDRSRWFRTLLPYAPPLVLWAIVYKVGGFGAHGSGLYVDPGDAPITFLRNVLLHWPLLAATELGMPGADFYPFLPVYVKASMTAFALGVIGCFLLAIRPLLRLDSTTRFFVFSSLLAILPSCATMPSSRLTFLASFGILGAFAQLIAAWRDRADWFPSRGLARLYTMPVVFWCALGHVFLSPLAFVFASHQMTIFEQIVSRLADGLPDDPKVEKQRVVIVNAPEPVFAAYIMVVRNDEHRPAPEKMLSMTSGARPVTLQRTGPATVVLSSPIGLVQPMTDLLTRDDRPFPVGYRVDLSDLSIEVTRVSDDGWPLEAKFTFHQPLENEAYRWMQWKNQTLAPLDVPKIGETISFPAQIIQMF